VEGFLSQLATLFGVGKLPKAPGTWGSLAALILGSVLVHYITWPVFALIIAALFLIGTVAASAHEKATSEHDSPKVVIDELVGMWIVLFPLEAFGTQLGDFRYDGLLAFALFRFFDILKPWPIKILEKKIPGGLGVMVDDVVAGVMAALVLMAIGYLV